MKIHFASFKLVAFQFDFSLNYSLPHHIFLQANCVLHPCVFLKPISHYFYNMKLFPSLVLFLNYITQVICNTNDISWLEGFCDPLVYYHRPQRKPNKWHFSLQISKTIFLHAIFVSFKMNLSLLLSETLLALISRLKFSIEFFVTSISSINSSF